MCAAEFGFFFQGEIFNPFLLVERAADNLLLCDTMINRFLFSGRLEKIGGGSASEALTMPDEEDSRNPSRFRVSLTQRALAIVTLTHVRDVTIVL